MGWNVYNLNRKVSWGITEPQVVYVLWDPLLVVSFWVWRGMNNNLSIMILVLCQNKKCTLTTFCITNKNKWNVFHFCHISRNNIHSLTYWFNPVASHEEYKRIKCSAMTSPLVGWKGSRPKMLKLQTVILLISSLIILTRSRHGFFHSFAGSPRTWGSGNQRHENDETLNGGIYYNVL